MAIRLEEIEGGAIYQCEDCGKKFFVSWEENSCQCGGCSDDHSHVCSEKDKEEDSLVGEYVKIGYNKKILFCKKCGTRVVYRYIGNSPEANRINPDIYVCPRCESNYYTKKD